MSYSDFRRSVVSVQFLNFIGQDTMLEVLCVDDQRIVDVDTNFMKAWDAPELQEEIDGFKNDTTIEIPVHSEAIEWIKQWSKAKDKDKDYPIQLSNLAKVAKAADYLGVESLYRTALKTIAEHATRERILEWGADLASMGEANLPLLDFLLAEQPSIELFRLLTDGDSVIALDEKPKAEYAIQFAAHRPNGDTLRLKQKGPIWVDKLGFCGTSEICYASYFDYQNAKQLFIIYDFVRDEQLCVIEDVEDACYCYLNPGRFIFWIKPNDSLGDQTTMHAIDIDTKVEFTLLSISKNCTFVNGNAFCNDLTISDKENGHLWTLQLKLSQDAYRFVPIQDPYGDVVQEFIVERYCSPDSTFTIDITESRPERLWFVALRHRGGGQHQLDYLGSQYNNDFFIDISPDSQSFVSADKEGFWVGRLEQAPSGNYGERKLSVHRIEDDEYWHGHFGGIAGVKYSPDCRYICVVCYKRRVLIYEHDIQASSVPLTYDRLCEVDYDPAGFTEKVDWSPEGEFLVLSCKFGAIRVPIRQFIRKEEQKRQCQEKLLLC